MSSITSNLSANPSNTTQYWFGEPECIFFFGPPDITIGEVRVEASKQLNCPLSEIAIVFKGNELEDHLKWHANLKITAENREDLRYVIKTKRIVNKALHSSSSSSSSVISPTPTVAPTTLSPIYTFAIQYKDDHNQIMKIYLDMSRSEGTTIGKVRARVSQQLNWPLDQTELFGEKILVNDQLCCDKDLQLHLIEALFAARRHR